MGQRYSNRGRDQINIGTVEGDVVVQHHDSLRPRSESLVLKAAKEEIISRLDQSLHQAVLINLGKQLQPEQVIRSWDAEIKIGSKPVEPLSSETTIVDAFERSDIAGKLLILGEPGSGKTTTMLDLAQALIQRAETDYTYPIPVLLNLSSWKDPRQVLVDWLVEELKSKYGIRKDIGKRWIEEKQLLPLLDGLDEVKPELQESCVQSINQWLQSELRPMYLLVCSRREEYGSYETRLELNGSIFLQSLTDTQIQHYLTTVNLIELWQILQQDSALSELLRIPLLLSITVLSYGELSLIKWQQQPSPEKRLELLLDAYIQRMLHHEFKSKIYKKSKIPKTKQTRRWLTFIAQQLYKDSQTEFLIENVQHTWLSSSRQIWIYKLSIGFAGGMIWGLIFGLFVGLTTLIISVLSHGLHDGLLPALIRWSQGLLHIFIYSLFIGSIFGFTGAASNLFKKFGQSQNWMEELKTRVINGLVFGLVFGIWSALLAAKDQNAQVPIQFQGMNKSLFFGIGIGSVFGLVGLSLNGLSSEIKTIEIVQWSISRAKSAFTKGVEFSWKCGKNIFVLGLILGSIFSLLKESMAGLPSLKSYTVFFAKTSHSFSFYSLGSIVISAFIFFGYICAFIILLRLLFSIKEILPSKIHWKTVDFYLMCLSRIKNNLFQEAKVIWRFKIYILIGGFLFSFIWFLGSNLRPILRSIIYRISLFLYYSEPTPENFLGLFAFVPDLILDLLHHSAYGLQVAFFLLALVFGVGLSVSIVLSLGKGLDHRIDEMKAVPNQGIWRSLINSSVFGTISGIGFALIIQLMIQLSLSLGANIESPPNTSRLDGIAPCIAIGCLLGGRAFGGATCIQHLTLRCILYYNTYIPWNYARFLNHATERLFLQRVGGRYRFIHKLLQEHFAAMKI
jgi:hypothetical protein